jgi:hypothetical protein
MPDGYAVWGPSSISIPGPAVNSATRPVPVSTNAGDAFLKPMWPDIPANLLAREMIGLRLAQAIGLDAPACCVYELGMGETVRDMAGNECDDGPALLVQSIPWANWDGTPEGLSPISNKRDLAGLVVLDTWLRNCDRYPPIATGRAVPTPSDGNLQNVALSPDTEKRHAFRVRAVDFSNTLHPGVDLDPLQLGPDAVADPGVYGLFPPFRALIKPVHVDSVVARLDSLSTQAIRGILEGVPQLWWPKPDCRAAVESFVLQRREMVRTKVKVLLGPLLGWLGTS